MSSNLEIEAKILVSEEEFQKVTDFFAVSLKDAVKQKNYYIDTPTQTLRQVGFGLRIREKDGYLTLTLKSPLSEGTLEKNQIIHKDEFTLLRDKNIFPSGPIEEFLTILGFEIPKLKILTSLTTERISVNYDQREISLDKNMYAEITDYEIESEQSSIDLAELILKKLCQDVGITFKLNNLTKHARALNASQI